MMPLRRHGPKAFDEVINMGIERGKVPARTGRDPAAKGGELEALRVVPDREVLGFQRGLDRRTSNARLNTCGTACRVDLEHTVELTQIEAHSASKPLADDRLDTSND